MPERFRLSFRFIGDARCMMHTFSANLARLYLSFSCSSQTKVSSEEAGMEAGKQRRELPDQLRTVE